MRHDQVAQTARALADAVRVQALALLAAALEAGPPAGGAAGRPPGLCVAELQRALGLSQPRASYHLAELRRAGLVREQRQGRQNFYILDHAGLHSLAAALVALAGAGGAPGAEAQPAPPPARPHPPDDRPAWLL